MRRSLSGSAQPGRDRQRSVGLGPAGPLHCRQMTAYISAPFCFSKEPSALTLFLPFHYIMSM